MSRHQSSPSRRPRCLLSGIGGLVGVLTLALVFSPRSAHAYLDPASGSMALQLLLGGVAGLALLVKLTWRRILTFLGFRQSVADDAGQEKVQGE